MPAAKPTVGPSSDTDSERERLRSALVSNRWNRAAAAKALGMSRTTLWRKMREFKLSD